jgi:release factor glutamine methyltransferase
LRPGGIVALEIGFDQGEAVRALLAAEPSFHGCALRKDYAGNDRVVLTRIRGDCM